MRAWSTSLRVLLSIALILNGISGAIAATRMPAERPSSMDVSPSSVGAAEMPCHQHQELQAGHPGAKGSPALPGKSPVPDCCKSGMCACACAHFAQIALSALQAIMPAPEHGLAVRPLSLEYATPALPHLIRPPIG